MTSAGLRHRSPRCHAAESPRWKPSFISGSVRLVSRRRESHQKFCQEGKSRLRALPCRQMFAVHQALQGLQPALQFRSLVGTEFHSPRKIQSHLLPRPLHRPQRSFEPRERQRQGLHQIQMSSYFQFFGHCSLHIRLPGRLRRRYSSFRDAPLSAAWFLNFVNSALQRSSPIRSTVVTNMPSGSQPSG